MMTWLCALTVALLQWRVIAPDVQMYFYTTGIYEPPFAYRAVDYVLSQTGVYVVLYPLLLTLILYATLRAVGALAVRLRIEPTTALLAATVVLAVAVQPTYVFLYTHINRALILWGLVWLYDNGYSRS